MDMPLYEINARLREVIESGWSVDTETGEILFEGPDGLDQLEMARSEKILSIGKVLKEKIRKFGAYSEERKEIEARLKRREDQAAKEIEWLRSYLETNMGDAEKVKDALVSIYWRTSESVEVLDPASLPDEYKRVRCEANKSALKTAISCGEVIPGVEIVTKRSVNVR